MAYNELMKSFHRIRPYMRSFYVYGFRHRQEFDTKSARSYDNERRRVENWPGDYGLTLSGILFRGRAAGGCGFLPFGQAGDAARGLPSLDHQPFPDIRVPDIGNPGLHHPSGFPPYPIPDQIASGRKFGSVLPCRANIDESSKAFCFRGFLVRPAGAWATMCQARKTAGGQGANEPFSEAEGMAEYLLDKGIEEHRITLEDKSMSTVENIQNSKALMEESYKTLAGTEQ